MAVGIWAWSIVRSTIFQGWENSVFERIVHGESAAVSQDTGDRRQKPPPVVRSGDLVGRLVIPRLNLRAMVCEGAGEDTLDVALGHIPGTALPGQNGNVGIAGHRDTLFRALRKIARNDQIEFQTPSGSYIYDVESTEIVPPESVGVLAPSKHPEITLVTCYPFYYVGSAPDRFVVKARLVSCPSPVILATGVR